MQRNRPREMELIETIQSSVLMQDTPHPLFHGSWDWHSAVHGHWALLHYARNRNDEALLDWLYQRFDTDAFALEVRYLLDNRQFERPYGRAWLLPMSIAHIKADMPRDIGPGIDAIAEDLWVDIAARETDSAIGEYQNQCWVLLQLYMWFSFRGSPIAAELKRHVDATMLKQGSHPAEDTLRPEFFSCWAVQALLIAEVLGPEALASWISEQSFSKADLTVLDNPKSVHHLGMNATRAWGFWAAWHATGNAMWREAYERHVDASFGLHGLWRKDHYSYGHWVPQFTLYASSLDDLHLNH